MLRAASIALVLTLCAARVAPAALAQDATRRCVTLSEGEAHARALRLQAEAEAGAPSARVWWWSWLGIFSAGVILQGSIALAVDAREIRWPMTVGAIGATLGTASMFITKARTDRLPARLREHELLVGNARLRAVEAEVARAGDGESNARNLVNHALGWGVAAGGLLTLWLGFDLLPRALINLSVSFSVGLTKILTGPTSARETWAAYQARHADEIRCEDPDADESSARAPLPEPRFTLAPAGLGAALHVSF
jgi:hypothetical protein